MNKKTHRKFTREMRRINRAYSVLGKDVEVREIKCSYKYNLIVYQVYSGISSTLVYVNTTIPSIYNLLSLRFATYDFVHMGL